MEEELYVVTCTVCNREVFISSLDKGTKWHGFLEDKKSHYFEYQGEEFVTLHEWAKTNTGE
jgi:tyrosyl-tRNA synthetase